MDTTQFGNQWVGYDSPASLVHKVDYALANRLGGMMMWALDLDDFPNGKWPILSTVAQRLFVSSSQTIALVLDANLGSNSRLRRLASADGGESVTGADLLATSEVWLRQELQGPVSRITPSTA